MARGRIGKLVLSTAIGSLTLGHADSSHGPSGVPNTLPPGTVNPSDDGGQANGNGNGNSNRPQEKKPANCDGSYLTFVKGYFTGTGNSTVAGNAIAISATVDCANGPKGVSFSAPSLTLNGDHFGGLGTANGTTLTLTGRIDGYDQDKNFRGARILVYYTDASGHRGRIAGVIVPP